MAAVMANLWTVVLFAFTLNTFAFALPSEKKHCPEPNCPGKNCRTKLDADGCLMCDCDCPLLVCGPHCRQQEDVHEGKCPECICDEQQDSPTVGAVDPHKIRCLPPKCEREDCIYVLGDHDCLVCRCDIRCPTCGADCKAESDSGPGHCPRCICKGEHHAPAPCSPPKCDGEDCHLEVDDRGCPVCKCTKDCAECAPGCVRDASLQEGGCPPCVCTDAPKVECLPPKCDGANCRLVPGDHGCLKCECNGNCTACPPGCAREDVHSPGACPRCVCPEAVTGGASHDARTGVQCTPPKCDDPGCRVVEGDHGCPTCRCDVNCPPTSCHPGCHPEEHTSHGRCARCICKDGTVDEPDDEPCFTPLLRKTLRRLAQLENKLKALHTSVLHQSARLERLSNMQLARHEDTNGTSDGTHHHHPQRDQGDHHDHFGHGHHPHHGHHGQHDSHHHSHHLHEDQDSFSERKAEAFAEPKLSETEYDFAICRMTPNTAIPEHEQQPVHGLISLWQQKGTKILNVLVQLTGFKTHQHNKIGGHVHDHRAYMHGMHVHTDGNLTESCQSTGSHYNPMGTKHGARKGSPRHVGDWGNIVCDKHGEVNVVFTDTVASLTGEWSIVGRSINVHAHMDDLGKNPDIPASARTGNSGPRVGCCIIEKVSKLPQLATRAAKRMLREIIQPLHETIE
ncbi:laminin subunit alpha-1-like [Ornithodoros turicata]|uniref:laminin subunit alpha-1-like n=1 Tax=Ornithodoros turicata TaxID=34597 RepID=UPI003138A1A4